MVDFSGATRGVSIGHISQRLERVEFIGLLKDGDEIFIDV